MTTTPHGRGRYTKGCRCGVCREANRQYARQYRAKSPLQLVAEKPTPPPNGEPVITSMTLTPIEPSTAVREAIQAQLDELGVAESRPGLAAIALKLAELLDNPLALPQHPAAAGRLVELLGRLSKERQRRGNLAAVRAMTSRSD